MAGNASAGLLVPVQEVIASLPGQRGAIGFRKDTTAIMVLRASAVSVDYRSLQERDQLITAFERMLTALSPDFPLQILLHAHRHDPELFFRQYVTRLRDPMLAASERQLVDQQVRHTAQTLMQIRPLEREAFIVIGYGEELGPIGDQMADNIPGLRAMARVKEMLDQRRVRRVTEAHRERSRDVLSRRAEQVISFCQSFEVEAVPLEEDDLLDLLYRMFHPGLAQRQKYKGGEGLGSYADDRDANRVRLPALPDQLGAQPVRAVQPELIPPLPDPGYAPPPPPRGPR